MHQTKPPASFETRGSTYRTEGSENGRDGGSAPPATLERGRVPVRVRVEGSRCCCPNPRVLDRGSSRATHGFALSPAARPSPKPCSQTAPRGTNRERPARRSRSLLRAAGEGAGARACRRALLSSALRPALSQAAGWGRRSICRCVTFQSHVATCTAFPGGHARRDVRFCDQEGGNRHAFLVRRGASLSLSLWYSF